jgi:hypothetical protein
VNLDQSAVTDVPDSAVARGVDAADLFEPAAKARRERVVEELQRQSPSY